jgi:hypothetical protein
MSLCYPLLNLAAVKRPKVEMLIVLMTQAINTLPSDKAARGRALMDRMKVLAEKQLRFEERLDWLTSQEDTLENAVDTRIIILQIKENDIKLDEVFEEIATFCHPQ